MQVITCMLTNPAKISTQQKLLDAAARIFASKGIDGATTREIAESAEVNEVTLFRKFGSKKALLTAVVENIFGEELTQIPVEPIAETKDLRSYLLEYSEIYRAAIAENLPLIRTMLGEIHRFQDHERQVFGAIFRPMKQRLAARIDREKTSSSTISGQILADQLSALIFFDVLRRSSPHFGVEYSSETYLSSCIDLIFSAAAA